MTHLSTCLIALGQHELRDVQLTHSVMIVHLSSVQLDLQRSQVPFQFSLLCLHAGHFPFWLLFLCQALLTTVVAALP